MKGVNSLKYFKIPLLLIIVIFLLSVSVFATDVTIVCNGNTLNFSDSTPYFDKTAGRIYVPVRPLTEALYADVTYESTNKIVTIKTDTVTVKLQIGSSDAYVNDVLVPLDAPAYILEGRTYVPLRFVSESFLMDVSYDSSTLTANLTNKKQLELGMSLYEAKLLYGEPNRIDTTEKGYEFHVYNEDLLNYTLIGIADGKVVSYYIGAANWMQSNGLISGMSRDRATICYPEDEYSKVETNSYDIFSSNDFTSTLFYDENNSVHAILVEKAEYTNKSNVTSEVLNSFELEIADLVNVQRARKSLPTLQIDVGVSAVAKQHAADMATSNFFSHTGSDKSTPNSRLESAGYSNFYQLEIIAEAYPNAICAFSGHMILSDYHEILEASYKKIGVGVAYNTKSDGILYYNHIFYADKR